MADLRLRHRLQLLHTLRSPDVGNRIEEGKLPQILSDALPPLRSSYPIVLMRPPYDERDLRSALPDLATAAAQPGSLVGVQISRASVDPCALRALVIDLSKRVTCPVVLLLQMSPEDGVLAAARLAPMRFRAVAPLGPGMQGILRDSLTDPSTLAQGVVDWLQLRSIRLNPNQADLIQTIFAAAPRHEDLTSLLGHHQIPHSSARFRLKKRGLPSPTRWFQLARALHAAGLRRHLGAGDRPGDRSQPLRGTGDQLAGGGAVLDRCAPLDREQHRAAHPHGPAWQCPWARP